MNNVVIAGKQGRKEKKGCKDRTKDARLVVNSTG